MPAHLVYLFRQCGKFFQQYCYIALPHYSIKGKLSRKINREPLPFNMERFDWKQMNEQYFIQSASCICIYNTSRFHAMSRTMCLCIYMYIYIQTNKIQHSIVYSSTVSHLSDWILVLYNNEQLSEGSINEILSCHDYLPDNFASSSNNQTCSCQCVFAIDIDIQSWEGNTD